jgi:hypothetical protein
VWRVNQSRVHQRDGHGDLAVRFAGHLQLGHLQLGHLQLGHLELERRGHLDSISCHDHLHGQPAPSGPGR